VSRLTNRDLALPNNTRHPDDSITGAFQCHLCPTPQESWIIPNDGLLISEHFREKHPGKTLADHHGAALGHYRNMELP
jgi:hypothetical protein